MSQQGVMPSSQNRKVIRSVKTRQMITESINKMSNLEFEYALNFSFMFNKIATVQTSRPKSTTFRNIAKSIQVLNLNTKLTKNLLCRVRSCFERHLKPLVLALTGEYISSGLVSWPGAGPHGKKKC
jgi:hypothetical protein